MHELVLANGVVDAVSNFARMKGGRVVSFTVAIGELSSFDKSLFEYLLKELVKGTDLEDAKITVEVKEARVKCLSCSSKWGFKELVAPLSEDEKEMIHFVPELVSAFAKCPACGSRDLQIESGRSVRVVEVVLE